MIRHSTEVAEDRGAKLDNNLFRYRDIYKGTGSASSQKEVGRPHGGTAKMGRSEGFSEERITVSDGKAVSGMQGGLGSRIILLCRMIDRARRLNHRVHLTA